MNMNKFNIGDDAFVFWAMNIIKFKVSEIKICKDRDTIDICGLTEANESIMAPEFICRHTVQELVDAFNNQPGQFFITLRPEVSFDGVVEL